MQNSRPKILLVTYTFAPENNPRAIRWLALVSELSKKFEVHVVTNFEFEWLDPSVKVYGKLKHNSSLNQSTVQRGFAKNIRRLLKLLVWPDFAAIWIPFGIRKVWQLGRSNRYLAILSSSHPISGHVPVFCLKSLTFLKDVPWLLDIGDPFGLVDDHNLNNQKIFGKLNYLFEKKICQMAQRVFVTTDSTRTLYLKGYDLPENKIKVAKPIVSPQFMELASKLNDASTKLASPYNIVFAGTLYKKIRNPDLVLKFADFVERTYPGRFKFHFFGSAGECRDQFDAAPKNVVLCGQVNQTDLVRFFDQSIAVINIGNKSLYQLPSKVIELVATKKLILNFSSNPSHDSSIEYLKGYPGHINIFGPFDFSDALIKLNELATETKNYQFPALDKLRPHLPAEVVKLFIQEIDAKKLYD